MPEVNKADAYDEIQALVRSECSVAEAMAHVIAHCERQHPHPDDPSNGDWPCTPAWFPKGRYAHSQVLASVYSIGYGGSEGALMNDATYPLNLAFAALSVRTLVQKLDKRLLLAGSRERTFVVGFDSGDEMVVGKLHLGGFDRA